VGMYVCGMTVQDKPHVGHIRASLSGDLMRRYLQHLGYEVTYVYNFTDVDDRIIDRANREGIGFEAVSERNIEAYLSHADLHNIQRATHYPRATQHIPQMLDLIALALWRRPVHECRMAAVEFLDLRSELLLAGDIDLVELMIRQSRTWGAGRRARRKRRRQSRRSVPGAVVDAGSLGRGWRFLGPPLRVARAPGAAPSR